MITDLYEMRDILHAYHDFQECILESLFWTQYGTVLTLRFDYIWDTDGSVRSNEGSHLMVELRLQVVQTLTVKNALSAALLNDLSQINWSHGEVSRIVVADDEESAAYAKGQTRFHHLFLRRESGVWIDSIFSALDVEETLEGPKMEFG